MTRRFTLLLLFVSLLSFGCLHGRAQTTPQRTGQTQDAPLDHRRIGFSPTIVRHPNLAPTDPVDWLSLSGAATLDSGITGPDRSAGAARLSTVLSGTQYKRLYSDSTTLTAYNPASSTPTGTWVMVGVWVRRAAESTTVPAPTISLLNAEIARVTLYESTEGVRLDGQARNYIPLRATAAADSGWVWLSAAGKVTRIVGSGAVTVRFDLQVTKQAAIEFYSPVLHVIQSGVYADAEISEWLQHFYPVPSGIGTHTVSLLDYQDFAIPKLGDGASTRMLTVSSTGAVSAQAIPSGGGGSLSDGDYGDITISGTSTVFTIDNDVITNAKVNSAAAIALSKLAPLTASRAVVSDGSGVLSVSAATATEVGYLSGVTSAIQTQITARAIANSTVGRFPYLSSAGTLSDSPLNRVSSSEIETTSGVRTTFNTTNSTNAIYLKGDPQVFLVAENLGTPGQPTTQSAYWKEGIISGTGNTGAITYNPVRWRGWNVSAPGSPIIATQPALWEAWEGSYDPTAVSAYPPSGANGYPWFEKHFSYRPASGSEIRLTSWTIRPANATAILDLRTTGFSHYDLSSNAVFSSSRGSLNLYGATSSLIGLIDEAGRTVTIQNTASALTIDNASSYNLQQAGSPSAGTSALTVQSVTDRLNTTLSYLHNGTSVAAAWTALTINNRTTTNNTYGTIDFNFNGTANVTIGAQTTTIGSGYGDFVVYTRAADGYVERVRVNSTGLGVGVSPAAKLHALATTQQLRLSYDASNYAPFTVSSGGDLTIAPTGGDLSITGTLAVSSTANITTSLTVPKVIWTGSVQDLSGSGSPESAITAAVGSVYRRTDGGANTSLYVKESGAGNTGWIAYGAASGDITAVVAGTGISGGATSGSATVNVDQSYTFNWTGQHIYEQATSGLTNSAYAFYITPPVRATSGQSKSPRIDLAAETNDGSSHTSVVQLWNDPQSDDGTLHRLKVRMTYNGGTAVPLLLTNTGNLTLTGALTLGSGPTTVSDSAGKILSAALNTVQPAQGGTGITALGTGVATWLGTPSSANLAAAITDETGSGTLVFATSPTLTTPTLGVATATRLGLGATADATAEALIKRATASVAQYSSTKAVIYQRGDASELGSVQYWRLGSGSGDYDASYVVANVLRAQASVNSLAGIEIYKDSTPTKAVNIGMTPVGSSTTDDLIFSLYDSGTGWFERMRLTNGGKLGIGATPGTSSALQVDSTTGAILFPRMTTTQRDALTGVAGMVIYNTTTSKLQVYTSSWVDLH